MKKIGTIISIILVVALVILTFVFLWKKSQPVDVVYEIVTATKGNIENTTIATGTVSPRDEVLIKPQISGIVSEVLKEAGQSVSTGEIIAKIQVVPESSNLNSAESQLNIAQINLNRIQATYYRQGLLFNKGVISREEMEQADAEYQRALEDVANAKDNLDIIKTGVSQKTAQYSNTQIKSTINGTILNIPVKVGNSVIQANNFNEGTTIASIANMNDMVFIGKVDETEVGKIHTGMKIRLTIGAVDNQKFDAIIEYVSPKGEEENGAVLFEIKAAANLAEIKDIRAGYSSNAEIALGNAKNVLTIPESSVSFSGDSAFVYVFKGLEKQNILGSILNEKSKQIFEKKYIKTGLSDGLDIEVKSGLKVGDRIRGREIQ